MVYVMRLKVLKILLIFSIACSVMADEEKTILGKKSTDSASPKTEEILPPEPSEQDEGEVKQKKKNTKKNHFSITAAFPIYRGFGEGIHKEPSFRPFWTASYARHFDPLFLELEGLYLNLPSIDITPGIPDKTTTTRFKSIGALVNGGLTLTNSDKFGVHLKLGAGLGLNTIDNIVDIFGDIQYIGEKTYSPLIQVALGFSYKIHGDIYLSTHLRYLYLHKFDAKMNYIGTQANIENINIVDLGTGITFKF